MAKTKTKTKGLQYSKPKTSLFLCCFGSFPHKTSTELTITGSEHNTKQKSRRWFPWQRIRLRVKKPTPKMVPLEASESYENSKENLIKLKSKGRAKKVHSSKWKSKSNLSSQTPPVLSATPNQTPSSQSQQTWHQNRENNNVEDDTRQQSSSSPARAVPDMPHAVSLPTAKRQVRRLLSSVQSQTTSKHPKQFQNARRYNTVVGTSVVMVTLVTVILWGRLCAILCTSAWLYFIPRFRMIVENDEENSNNSSNDLDLDSKVHRKKVILDGLLQRNHRGTL